MVLGNDLLNDGHAVLDYRLRLLTWHGQQFPIRPECPQSVLYRFDATFPGVGCPEIHEIVEANADVFANTIEPTGDCPLIPMSITTTGPPIAQKAYRLPLTKRKIVEEELQDMLPHDIIEPSVSIYASR